MNYFNFRINYISSTSIKDKLFEFLQGFYDVIPLDFIEIFTAEEFEIILNGLPFIDMKDWMQNTIYKGEYHKDHEKINWFWKIVEDFNERQKSKLLQFCTGSKRVSLEGFRY